MSKKKKPPKPISNWGGDSGLGSASGLLDRGVPPSGVRPSLANALPDGYSPEPPFGQASARHGLALANALDPTDFEGDETSPAAAAEPELPEAAEPDMEKRKRPRPALTQAEEIARAEADEPSVKPTTGERVERSVNPKAR